MRNVILLISINSFHFQYYSGSRSALHQFYNFLLPTGGGRVTLVKEEQLKPN